MQIGIIFKKKLFWNNRDAIEILTLEVCSN